MALAAATHVHMPASSTDPLPEVPASLKIAITGIDSLSQTVKP